MGQNGFGPGFAVEECTAPVTDATPRKRRRRTSGPRQGTKKRKDKRRNHERRTIPSPFPGDTFWDHR